MTTAARPARPVAPPPPPDGVEAAPLRVAVVAAPALRAGLAALLADDGRLAVVDGPAGAAPELLPVDDGTADAIVWAPPPRALDAVPAALARAGAGGARGAAVILVVDAPGAAWSVAALRAGARAVVPGAADGAELRAAVEAAAAGFVALPRELAADLLARTAAAPDEEDAPEPPSPDDPLSPREHEVLALLAEGLANKQIAPRLGISEHTVKAHVTAIFAKLGAGTRAEAVVLAARRGLLML